MTRRPSMAAPTFIVGVSTYYHDSAACLVRDSDIVAAAQEERFTRKKHDPGFPHRAIDFCLKAGGVEWKDIEHLVFYDKSLVKFERLLETYLAFAPTRLRSFLAAKPNCHHEQGAESGIFLSAPFVLGWLVIKCYAQ